MPVLRYVACATTQDERLEVDCPGVRIDRFLHCIRLVKSRSQAQALVEAGHVRIDGRRVAKPSDPVRADSIIALPLRGQVRVLKVLGLPARRGPPSEARACYREIDGDGAAT